VVQAPQQARAAVERRRARVPRPVQVAVAQALQRVPELAVEPRLAREPLPALAAELLRVPERQQAPVPQVSA
jgi:hypothetical protein